MENPEKIKNFKAKVKLEDDAKKEELKTFLSSKYGRTWMFDLLTYCGYDRAMSASTPHAMAMCVGRHDVYLELIRQLDEIDPHLFATMKVEAKPKEVIND